MSVEIVPRIEYAHLERILQDLPEPTTADVILVGDVNYEGLSSVIDPSLSFKPPRNYMTTLGLENPTKAKVLELYRTDSESEAGITKNRTVEFSESSFYLEGRANITISPWKVSAKYRGKEPESIKRVREITTELSVPFELKANC